MTLSVWRYAHFLLAVFSSLFLVIASLTGIILAADAINEKIPPYKVEHFDSITLAETLPVLKKNYPEITEITVDHNGFVLIQGMNTQDNDVNAYVNPLTGKLLGTPEKKSAFIQWTTSLHRSLFLHETGRIFVGVNAFLLLLISLSGIILVIQRQQGILRFFNKISKDSFAQFYHVLFGRIMLLPIFILALSGTFLSLDRFHFFGEEIIEHNIKSENTTGPKPMEVSDILVFKNTKLSDVNKIEFPFTDDPDEYYTLKLKDSDVVVSQFTGKVLSHITLKKATIYATLSLLLHTGRVGIVWAIVLAISSISILFFIFSGFSISLKRRAIQISNTFSAKEGEIILVVGSENGSTLHYANAIHKQLIALGKVSYLCEANQYTNFPSAKHILLFTSTHGLGEAPSNATKLLSLIERHPQPKDAKFSVVGFGSLSYPDFCGFAKKVNNLLVTLYTSDVVSPLHTINDKSAEAFVSWIKQWSEFTQIQLSTTTALYNSLPRSLKKFKVLKKVSDGENNFVLTIKPPRFTKFKSGDLLAIYPNNNAVERLYSVGKINNTLQLVVKLHENGIGSNYLNNLKHYDSFKARIVDNKSFHLPEDKSVIMIANGTGIAPFLGMFTQGGDKYNYQLYCGFRKETILTREYKNFAKEEMQRHHLKGFHLAFSREANHIYVMDLIKRDADVFINHLKNGGIVMLCGAIAMQQDVETLLDRILLQSDSKPLSHYKSEGQILADCY